MPQLRKFTLLLASLVVLFACRLQAPEPPVEVIEEAPVLFYPAPTDTSIPRPSPTLTSSPLPPPPSPLPSATPSPTPVPNISLAFTGVIVPARCVQAAIDERGDADYIYEDVRHILRKANITVGTLNATLTDFPPRTGCVITYVLVGGSINAGAMSRAGFDVMSVATNHIKNCGIGTCGDQAFYDTLENLRKAGIEPVGAGANHDEAMQPVVLDVKGVRFGIVSLGQIEPMAFATSDQPGIAELTDDNLRTAITEARNVSDVVIAMPHWGPEYSPKPNHYQLHFARVAVEAGVDLVVGNHTHVVQAYQEIEGVPVFYGLGNFVFDQVWSRETQQGVILVIHFEGTRYSGHEFIPTHVDGDGRVRLANEAEAEEILRRIEEASRTLNP
jgi:poly-gamma-glutamate capsule biosynthesis protein CapA/YwtB (metallophosphatase superfamily)